MGKQYEDGGQMAKPASEYLHPHRLSDYHWRLQQSEYNTLFS